MSRRRSGPRWQAGRERRRLPLHRRALGRVADAAASLGGLLRPGSRSWNPESALERIGQASETRRGRIVFAAICLELAALLVR